MIKSDPDQYQEIRDAVRALCAEYPDEYHRKIDEQRGYPEAFVDALTKAGWMAALIPQEYGGSGLGLTDVQHGHAPSPRLDGAESALPAKNSQR
jgi:acyl-CoA dehydrogenase